jgi:hypothetical protein
MDFPRDFLGECSRFRLFLYFPVPEMSYFLGSVSRPSFQMPCQSAYIANIWADKLGFSTLLCNILGYIPISDEAFPYCNYELLDFRSMKYYIIYLELSSGSAGIQAWPPQYTVFKLNYGTERPYVQGIKVLVFRAIVRVPDKSINTVYRCYGNFSLLRPYHGEHGPKVPVTLEYIVLQRVLQKRECMSILTRMIMHLISNDWLIKLGYLNNL